MMKGFDAHRFDVQQCRHDLLEFKELLASREDLSEKEQILPFFRARRDLSALIGSFEPNIGRFDLIAYEYDIFGDFAADLVVGDSEMCAFNFVEFEDATPRSLFVKRRSRSSREWSTRLDHGFGQIIDWFYKLADRRNSDDYEARFGKRTIKFTGTLVVGREHYMEPGEKLRLEWRRQHVIVNSKQVVCITFDELLYHLQRRLALFTRAAESGS